MNSSTNFEQRKIQRAMKALMKKRRMTYQDIAKSLKVSTATVKRRLNGGDLSVDQLSGFAQALSVSFYELIEYSKTVATEAHLFTPEQEAVLARNVACVRIFRRVLMGHSFPEIQAGVGLKEVELRKHLRELEGAGLLRLLQGDRIAARVSFPFRWQPGGQLDRAYTRQINGTIGRRLLNHGGRAGLHRSFELLLSPESYQSFCSELEAVYMKYRGFSEVFLESRFKRGQLVSGVLFADTFSAWGDEGSESDAQPLLR